MKDTIISKRNRYEIKGDVVELTITRLSGAEFVITFDVEDLDLVQHHSPWAINATGEEKQNLYVIHHFSNGGYVLLHRLIAQTEKGEKCDLIDNDGLNCRRSNLRNGDARTVMEYRRSLTPNSSGHRYIYKCPDRSINPYQVRIWKDGKCFYPGGYGSLEDAIKSRDQWLAGNGRKLDGLPASSL